MASDIEQCESRLPDCGPVEHHDCDSVPLCARCWADLVGDGSAKARGLAMGITLVESPEKRHGE